MADAPPNDACLACHAGEGFKPFVAGDTFGASVHGTLPCVGCHADATEVPHRTDLKAVDPSGCAVCHEGVVTKYTASIHGQARANGSTEAATCTSCHGPAHELRRVSDPMSSVYPLNLPRSCGVCHGDPEMAKRHGIEVTDAYQLYMDSIHGRALTKSGLLVAAHCGSCHGAHDIRPLRDASSKVNRRNVPATCGSCHAGILDLYRKSTHGKALAAGSSDAPVCIDCHTAHRIARVETEAWKLDVIGECGTCHEQSLRTYRDTFHGQVTALGFTRVARCSDCHGSHGILPASDPNSTIAPGNLVATCQQCHPGVGASFAEFSPHADAADREKYPLLYWVAVFMNLLIIGVFLFFGAHSALWFIRSAIARARGEGAPGGDDDEPKASPRADDGGSDRGKS